MEQTSKAQELQLLEAQQKAEFALTPIGKMVASMNAINQVADFYSKSDFVPATFKGKKENCAVAVDMAIRMNMNPIMVMQNMYVVHGQPSLSSKLIIAMINNCGEFEPLSFEGKKNMTGNEPNFGVRAYTYRKNDPEHKHRLEGTWITNEMIKKEGWGAKWQTMPEQMFRYRAATFWARTNAPEITMGIMSKEEVDEPSFVMAQAEEIHDEPKSLADLAMQTALNTKKPEPKQEPISFDVPTSENESENINPKAAKTLL